MTTGNAPLTLIEPDDTYRLQEQVGFVLRKAHQRHVAIFANRIADLTPPQFAALAKLYEVGEASQNQLGQMIAMDAATVKGVIDRLRSRGYVDLNKHDSDKRLLLVSLTAAGRDAVEELIPLAKAITEETLASLTAKEAAQFLRLLGKIA
jgi:DNA-binding MarR family transcriptional regulator